MELKNLIENLRMAMGEKEEITEGILRANTELAELEKEYRGKIALELIALRDKKTPTVIINKIAEGNTRDAIYKIEVLQYKIKYMKDKLENIRQDIEVYRSLVKNERELINII